MLNKKIKEVDYKKGDNQIPNSEVKHGTTASEKMPPELEIKTMREFYVTVSRYLISRLPIDDEILKAFRGFQSIDAKPTWNNKMTEEIHCSCSSCSNRHRGGFRIGRVDSIYTRRYIWELVLDKTTYHRVDHYWKNVFQLRNSSGQPNFVKLQKFIPCLLTISHGNTDVERSLSHNKNVLTSERSSLSPEVFYKSGIVSMIRRGTMRRSWIKLRSHRLEASENCLLELM